ncbi:glyoxal reductase-like [Glandiceps talaboti]
MANTPTVVLNTGACMPIFGLGTYRLVGTTKIYETIDRALKLGYRSIDTAESYKNEEDIGTALKELLPKYQIDRKDVFITSKLSPKNQGQGLAYEACLKSIARLQLEYLDLYLIHWPGKTKLKPDDTRNRQYRMESWLDMEKLVHKGLVKNIGVSNYTVKHLDDTVTYTSISPAVLQVEFHPHLVQRDLLEWCQSHQVHLQAYRSIGIEQLQSDPTLQEIAKRHGVTGCQVLLKWAVQQSIGVIPKASSQEHLEENINIWNLTLTEDDMTKLEQLHQGTHYCWDPVKVA